MRSLVGHKKILSTDIGKDVRTCTGSKIGTVSEVSRKGEFRVSVTASEEEACHRSKEDAPSMEPPGSYRPGDIEMITEEAVWLRL